MSINSPVYDFGLRLCKIGYEFGQSQLTSRFLILCLEVIRAAGIEGSSLKELIPFTNSSLYQGMKGEHQPLLGKPLQRESQN